VFGNDGHFLTADMRYAFNYLDDFGLAAGGSVLWN
jgi:hypothetical protein